MAHPAIDFEGAGGVDLDRLERMILRRVTREYFLLGGRSDDD